MGSAITKAPALVGCLFSFTVACGSGRTASAPNASPPNPATSPSDQPVELVARFGDAGGLTRGTRVIVAGLPLGRVTRVEPLVGGTHVWFELRDAREIWSSATLRKKPSSTLGEFYLELDPGTAGGSGGNGTESATQLGPACPGYRSTASEEALRCRTIVTVIETESVEELRHRVEATLPHLP